METQEPRPAPHGDRIAYVAVFVLMITCGVLLVINHRLQAQIGVLADQYHALSTTEGPPIGSKILTLHGESISGQPMTLDLAQRDSGTLLLILSPKCPHCKANFQNWRDLLPLVPASQVVWVDVTDSADPAYLSSVNIPQGASVIRLDSDDRARYNLFATPTTIWLQPHAVVKNVWTGELQTEDLKQVRGTLQSPGA